MPKNRKRTPTRDSALRRDLASAKYRQRVVPDKRREELGRKWRYAGQADELDPAVAPRGK
jgi:hypothetical protein